MFPASNDSATRALQDDAELLAVLWGSRPVASARSRRRARATLLRAGGLARLSRRSVAELADLGVPVATQARWRAALLLADRFGRARLSRGARVSCAEDVGPAFALRLGALTTETFWALALDAGHRVIDQECLAHGGPSAVQVSVGAVFAWLLRVGAAATVVVHNHPSGDVDGSPEDWALTTALIRAGDLMGIQVLDHVIVTQGEWRSLAEQVGVGSKFGGEAEGGLSLAPCGSTRSSTQGL